MSAIPQAITPNPHTNLLNVYIQIANKMGFQQQQKKDPSKEVSIQMWEPSKGISTGCQITNEVTVTTVILFIEMLLRYRFRICFRVYVATYKRRQNFVSITANAISFKSQFIFQSVVIHLADCYGEEVLNIWVRY
jgi:hypothetical protein